MSRPPATRSSQASGLAPNVLQPMRGSSIFAPPAPAPPQISMVPSRPQSRVEPPPLSSTIGPMPGTRNNPLPGPRKRLIVTCDGTWLNSDKGITNGRKQPPSNVSRIGWAIKDTSRDGIPQVVHYQAGVGTTGTRLSRVLGGALGEGLKENVREAYSYLAINYREGDEIFLMGFSRGAFTARSVGGMIGQIGLLTRTGLPHFNEIFEDMEHQYEKNYVSIFPNSPFEGKGPFGHRYVAELEKRGYTRRPVMIKAICCWDTVGSLGIPRVGFLEMLGIQSRTMKEYQFYDTTINPCVENAFQALALDERRGPFSPAVWEMRDNDKTNLRQVWFAGVHSNVGGGYQDSNLANLTLAWMISRLEPFLDFRDNYLISCHEENRLYYKNSGERTRLWGFGQLYSSFKGIYSFTGSKTRTPGCYFRTDPFSGDVTNKRLKNTNEYIHASVRSRMGLRGPGQLDKGDYDPPALRDWTFAQERAPPGQGGNVDGTMVVWTNHGDKGGQDRMPEAVLLETELTLLRNSPRVEEYIRSLKEPTKDKRRSRRMDGDPAAAGALPNGGEHQRKHRDRNGDADPDRTRKRRSRRHDD